MKIDNDFVDICINKFEHVKMPPEIMPYFEEVATEYAYNLRKAHPGAPRDVSDQGVAILINISYARAFDDLSTTSVYICYECSKCEHHVCRERRYGSDLEREMIQDTHPDCGRMMAIEHKRIPIEVEE